MPSPTNGRPQAGDRPLEIVPLTRSDQFRLIDSALDCLETETNTQRANLKALLDRIVYTASDDGRCHLSRRQHCEKLRWSLPKFDSYRKKLESLGWIRVGREPRRTGGQGANSFSVDWHALREQFATWRNSTAGIGASDPGRNPTGAGRIPTGGGTKDYDPPPKDYDPPPKVWEAPPKDYDPYIRNSFHNSSTPAPIKNHLHEGHEDFISDSKKKGGGYLPHLDADDLEEIGRVLAIYRRWAGGDPARQTDRIRLQFVACSIRAVVHGESPPKLMRVFVQRLERGVDPGLSNSDEDLASEEIATWQREQRDRQRGAGPAPEIQPFRSPTTEQHPDPHREIERQTAAVVERQRQQKSSEAQQ